MASIPDVSVVILPRDRWRLLSATPCSAFRQDGVELEVLAVDGGASDERPARLSEFRSRCQSAGLDPYRS